MKPILCILGYHSWQTVSYSGNTRICHRCREQRESYFEGPHSNWDYVAGTGLLLMMVLAIVLPILVMIFGWEK